MPFENLPVYKDAELETIASQFLASHYGSAVRIPVDVDWLIGQLPNVKFDDYPALRENYGVEGMVVRDTESGKLIVYIDEKVMDDDTQRGVTRYRTTVAEEIAHILIHRELIEQVDSPEKFRQLHNALMDAKVERNAKRLAVALLTPKEQLWNEASEEYRHWVLRFGTDEPEKLKLLICGGLERRFRVSNQVMKSRLAELKIFQRIEEAAYRGLPRLS